jgi:AcrR family transcriptional regulator
VAELREAAPLMPRAALSGGLSEKLRPGPGRPAEQVAYHQRARIFAAMIEIVGEEGYDAVTVRRLSSLAGVSTRAFYANFEGKEECFLRTYELVVRRAATRVADAQVDGGDWLERLRLGFAAFAGEIEARPCAARLALVEAFSAGPAVIEQMKRSEALFEAMISGSLSHAPDGIAVPPLVVKGIVAGVSCLARKLVLTGRERDMPLLADELLDWALAFHDPSVELLDAAGSSVPVATPARRSSRPYGLADERDLLLSAVEKLALAEGYERLSLEGISAVAGLRKKSLEAQFESADECFFAALEKRVFAAIDRASAPAKGFGWSHDVRGALTVFCEEIVRDPALARLAFVEAFASGGDGARYRQRLLASAAERFHRQLPDDLQFSSEASIEASLGAVWKVLHAYVTAGRTQQLPCVAPTLSFIVLAPLIGAEDAISVCTNEHHQDEYALEIA